MAEPVAEVERAEALLRHGQSAQALQAAEAQLRVSPDDSRALIVRANAANALGQLDLLIDSLQSLLRLHPLHPRFTRMLATALNNRGSRALQNGHHHVAKADIEQAISLWPEHPQAWFNLGLCLDPEQAAVAFQRHLLVNPDDGAAKTLLQRARNQLGEVGHGPSVAGPIAAKSTDSGWLAHTAARSGMLEATLSAFERLSPTHDLDAATEALSELRLRGEVQAAEQASKVLVRVASQAGRAALRARFIGELTLPAIYRSKQDLLEHRERFEQGLGRLENQWDEGRIASADTPLRELSHSNFLLAYQGLSDRELQVRFARLVEQASQRLRPELAEPGTGSPGRRRVGLLSAAWRRCTVGAYFGRWIDWLGEAGFEVYLYQLGPQRDDQTGEFAKRASVFRYLEGRLESLAETVRDDHLDLLIYPEIGMDARLTPLASLRLARRQAVAWGHPTSSGFSTIDAYFSCAGMEPDNAAEHYSEPLHLLPGIGVDYLCPSLPARQPPEHFGLDPSRPRVLVPQSLFKLHPDTDEVMAGIAERLPAVQFVLFEPEYAGWRVAFMERLQRAFSAHGGSAERHVRFMPLMPRHRYLQVNMACDVMLDSLHWSGGNTAIDALLCGLPLVACPGDLMRGRQSHAMLKLLQLDAELSTSDAGQQIERVAALAADPAARRELQPAIAERMPALLDAGQARQRLINLVEELITS